MRGLESYPSRIEYNGRKISVSTCPIGINPDDFEATDAVCAALAQLRSKLVVGGTKRRLVASLDRLDRCKGIPQKLLAMEARGVT